MAIFFTWTWSGWCTHGHLPCDPGPCVFSGVLSGACGRFEYKAIHRFLFSDLYDWAGEVRTVNISKKDTQFTLAENIEHQAELIFRRLKERNYFKGLSHGEFIDEIVYKIEPADFTSAGSVYYAPFSV